MSRRWSGCTRDDRALQIFSLSSARELLTFTSREMGRKEGDGDTTCTGMVAARLASPEATGAGPPWEEADSEAMAASLLGHASAGSGGRRVNWPFDGGRRLRLVVGGERVRKGEGEEAQMWAKSAGFGVGLVGLLKKMPRRGCSQREHAERARVGRPAKKGAG